MFSYFMYPVKKENFKLCEKALRKFIKTDAEECEEIENAYLIEIDKTLFKAEDCDDEMLVDNYFVLVGCEDYDEEELKDILYANDDDYLKMKELASTGETPENRQEFIHYLMVVARRFEALGPHADNISPDEELDNILNGVETKYGKIVKKYK